MQDLKTRGTNFPLNSVEIKSKLTDKKRETQSHLKDTEWLPGWKLLTITCGVSWCIRRSVFIIGELASRKVCGKEGCSPGYSLETFWTSCNIYVLAKTLLPLKMEEKAIRDPTGKILIAKIASSSCFDTIGFLYFDLINTRKELIVHKDMSIQVMSIN